MGTSVATILRIVAKILFLSQGPNFDSGGEPIHSYIDEILVDIQGSLDSTRFAPKMVRRMPSDYWYVVMPPVAVFFYAPHSLGIYLP